MADTLKSSILIKVRPTVLWNRLTLAQEIADWYDDCDAVDRILPPGQLRAGSTFRLVRPDRYVDCHVTVADPLLRLRWLEFGDERGVIAVEFRLAPDGTDRTVLTHTKTVVAPGLVNR